MFKIEQLNIVGKRSGQGSVVHKATLVNALSRALAERDKRLKVTCGNNTSYLDDSAWIGEKTPMTLCEVRFKSG